VAAGPTPPPWVPIAVAVPLSVVGAVGLIRFLFKGAWGPAAFVAVWLVALAFMTRFNYRRSQKRETADQR
jgi:hypothetical protein